MSTKTKKTATKHAPTTTSKPPELPPVVEGFRRHPVPLYALSGFLGALIDCVPCRTPDGDVREVLAFVVREGAPLTWASWPENASGKAKVGDLVFIDAPELLALGGVAKAGAQFGLQPNQALLVRLHRLNGGHWIADIANEPTTR